MNKFFKTILLGFISLLALVGCNEPQWSHVADWTQGGNQSQEITVSTSDVNITKASLKSVTGNGIHYYFIVETTCSYKNADIYGSFTLMNSAEKVLEQFEDVKATSDSSSYDYEFKIEIKENTFNQYRTYTAFFKGKAYTTNANDSEIMVGDETVTANSLYISNRKPQLIIKSLYNLTYLSYSVSLFFNTSLGPITIDGEIKDNIEANKEKTIVLDTTINFSYEIDAFTFEVKTAKTKDKIEKGKKLEDKKYSYIFLDEEDSLFAFKLVKAGESPVIDKTLNQTFENYPYLEMDGYTYDKGNIKMSSLVLPTATQNLIFRPTVETNETKLVQEAKKKNNTQKSSLKVVVEYYDTVLGVIKYTAAESHGSGIVIAGDKSSNNEYYYALTNYHVIDAIAEKNYSGHEGIRGKVIDYDEQEFVYSVFATDKEHDLALIRFQANKTIHPAFIEFEEADAFKYNCVVSIGCPGDSFLKVTTGNYTGTLNLKNSYGNIQTDITHTATINKGSSGGPLFNWKLHLVGINQAISESGKYCAVRLTDIRNFVYKYNLPF